MADSAHADSEETQSHEYISASNRKFLQPDQWIWYDDGRTDGADADAEHVAHPLELQHRIFVRLPAGQTPGGGALAYTVRTTSVSLAGCSHLVIRGLRTRRALTGISVSRDSRDIRLHNLVVEEFGGGRKLALRFLVCLSENT